MSVTTATLEQICEINPRLSPDVDQGQPVSFVPMSHVDTDTAVATASEERSLRETRKGFTPFQNKDIIVAKITPCFENGKIAQVNIARNIGFGSTEFHIIRPNPQQADPRFLLHFLRRENVRKAGEVKMTGSGGQRRIPESFLKNIAVPLPDLVEQRRIAAVLDQTASLHARRRETLNQIDELNQSIFGNMFGNPETICEQWPTKNLGSLADFVTSGSRGWAKYYSAQGAPFLRIQNVGHDELDTTDLAKVEAPNTAEAKRTRVEADDILLSITADLGRTAVTPETLGEAYINQHLALVRTSKAVPRFLSNFLISPAGKRKILKKNRKGVKSGLNFSDIKSIEVPIPPTELQEEFAQRAEITDRMKQQHRAHLAQLDELFASLQDRAFSGRL